MPGLSFDVLRIGKRYRLTNFRERFEFVIEEILADHDFKMKDIHTLEIIYMHDLIKFGKGADFEIRELE